MARTRNSNAARGDGALPLSGVIAVLTRAAERGELSANELDWSIARLSGKVRAGNPRLEGVDRRDSIMRAAIEIFRREGYSHATIEAIANELFVTKAAVYHYFSSKQDILDAICERSSIATRDAVIAANEAGGDPDPRLRSMLSAYAWACMNEPGFNVLMRHFDEVSPAELENVRRRAKEVEAAFRETVAEGVAAGAFQPPDPHITVFGMLGALNYMYAWFKHDGRLPPEAVRDALVTFIVDGVRGNRGRTQKAPTSNSRTARSRPR
jgi:AcrR family transcriptional regulator